MGSVLYRALVCTCVRIKRTIAMATVRRWPLFHSELLIVQLLFEYGKHRPTHTKKEESAFTRVYTYILQQKSVD